MLDLAPGISDGEPEIVARRTPNEDKAGRPWSCWLRTGHQHRLHHQRADGLRGHRRARGRRAGRGRRDPGLDRRQLRRDQGRVRRGRSTDATSQRYPENMARESLEDVAEEVRGGPRRPASSTPASSPPTRTKAWSRATPSASGTAGATSPGASIADLPHALADHEQLRERMGAGGRPSSWTTTARSPIVDRPEDALIWRVWTRCKGWRSAAPSAWSVAATVPSQQLMGVDDLVVAGSQLRHLESRGRGDRARGRRGPEELLWNA